MTLPPPTAVEARRLKRAAAVSAQRRSGNGTVTDLATFCCVSERTVLNWKEEKVIGYTQIGGNIWFSEDDVAELPAQYHHAGKFSKLSPSEVANRVRQEWRKFLGAVDADAARDERLARIEERIFGAAEPTVKASGNLCPVPSAAAPLPFEKEAA